MQNQLIQRVTYAQAQDRATAAGLPLNGVVSYSAKRLSTTWTDDSGAVVLMRINTASGPTYYAGLDVSVPVGYRLVPVVCDGDKHAFVCPNGITDHVLMLKRSE